MDPKFIIFAGHKEASSAISLKYCLRMWLVIILVRCVLHKAKIFLLKARILIYSPFPLFFIAVINS